MTAAKGPPSRSFGPPPLALWAAYAAVIAAQWGLFHVLNRLPEFGAAPVAAALAAWLAALWLLRRVGYGCRYCHAELCDLIGRRWLPASAAAGGAALLIHGLLDFHSKAWQDLLLPPMVLLVSGAVCLAAALVERRLRVQVGGGVLLRDALEDEARRRIAVLENAPDGILVFGSDGRVAEANRRAEEIFAYPPGGLLGLGVEELMPERLRAVHKGHRAGYARAPHARPMAPGSALLGRRRDGSEFPVEISLGPLSLPGGAVGTVAIVRDSTARAAMEERLRESLAVKETLLREVHHRVKNNLQVVSSLLSLAVADGDGEGARVREILDASRLRVAAIAAVHDILHRSDRPDRVCAREFVTAIAENCARTFAAPAPRLSVEDFNLDLDTAAPLGLLINELLSNAFKHSGRAGSPPAVALTLGLEGGRARLLVSDEGPGLPERPRSGLGTRLIESLRRQLRATLSRPPGPGARCEIVFPVNPVA